MIQGPSCGGDCGGGNGKACQYKGIRIPKNLCRPIIPGAYDNYERIVRHCAAVCLARSFTGSLATRGTAADLYLEILKEFGLGEK